MKKVCRKKEIKSYIYGLIGFVCLFLAFGFTGGVENGADLKNMIYAFISLGAGFFAFYKGGYVDL